jgi:hypothetical protein
MRTTTGLAGLSTCAALAMAAGSTAGSGAERFSGAVCVPSTPADAAKLNYSYYGVNNVSSEPATVVCPFPHWKAGSMTLDPGEFDLIVYDRSPSAGVSCVFRGSTSNGDPLFTGTQTTSISGFGQPASRLTWVMSPIPGGPRWYTATCTLPGMGSGGTSHIATGTTWFTGF